MLSIYAAARDAFIVFSLDEELQIQRVLALVGRDSVEPNRRRKRRLDRVSPYQKKAGFPLHEGEGWGEGQCAFCNRSNHEGRPTLP